MPRVFGILIFLCIGLWMVLRIIDAIRQGEVSTKSKFEFETHYYKRATTPYMFWQTIVMFGLGAGAAWIVVILMLRRVI